jgi:hypothetical protein
MQIVKVMEKAQKIYCTYNHILFTNFIFFYSYQRILRAAFKHKLVLPAALRQIGEINGVKIKYKKPGCIYQR